MLPDNSSPKWDKLIGMFWKYIFILPFCSMIVPLRLHTGYGISSFHFCSVGPFRWINLIVPASGERVYRYTDKPQSVQRKSRNRIELYRTSISAVCHLLIHASESLVFPKNSDRNQLYFNLQKDFRKQKRIIFFFFPPLAVLHIGHTIYSRTPIDTARRPLTPQDALCMVRKSFILFYMINYHEFITFLLCIIVSHRRTYKFYNLYWTYMYLINSTRPCH